MKMKMDDQRFRWVLVGVLLLTIGLFIFTLTTGLSKLAAKGSSTEDLKVQSKALDAQIIGLNAAKKEVSQYSYFNDVAKSVLPSDKDQTQAVSDLIQMANLSGFTLQNITFPSSTLGAAALAAPAATDGSTSTTPAAVPSSLSQVKPVLGINGLYSIAITVTPASGNLIPDSQQVTYPKLLDFLHRIENNRRTAQVSQVTIQPLSTGYINFNLTLNLFIKP
jgi:hypothetical protein